MNPDRRSFLQTTSAAALASALSANAAPQKASGEDKFGKILPTRILGKSGLEVTNYCAGGSHIGRMEAKDAEKIIERYIERGVRFFDTAVAYKQGRSERYYGKFLTPKYRDHIKLFSKSLAKDAKGVRKHVEESLKRCKTDYFDIYFIHSIESPEDVETRLKQGVYDELVKIKREGQIKHIAFSGHTDYNAHKRLLAEKLPELDACMLPFNVADPSYQSYILNVVPELNKQNLGIIAMKTLAGSGLFGVHPFNNTGKVGERVIPDKLSVAEALRFSLSGPVTAVVNGVENLQQLDENLDTFWNHTPMPEEERQRLVKLVEEEGRSGVMEYFKKQGQA